MVRHGLAWTAQLPASVPVVRTYLVVPAACAGVAISRSPTTADASDAHVPRVLAAAVSTLEVIAALVECIIFTIDAGRRVQEPEVMRPGGKPVTGTADAAHCNRRSRKDGPVLPAGSSVCARQARDGA